MGVASMKNGWAARRSRRRQFVMVLDQSVMNVSISQLVEGRGVRCASKRPTICSPFTSPGP
jgi:hypothetical protein